MGSPSYRKPAGSGASLRPPDGWDPFKHVLWCFQGDKEALHNALCEVENRWERGAVSRSSQLKRQLLHQFVFILFLFVGLSIRYVVEFDTGTRVLDAPQGDSPLPSSQAQLKPEVPSAALTPAVGVVESSYAQVASLIPLVMQLAGYVYPPRHALTFKLRESSVLHTAQDDWEALLQLQRQCALPIRSRTVEGGQARYQVSETIPHGKPIIRIPRSMMLSTLRAPAFVVESCWFEVAGRSLDCGAQDLLALLLIIERRLQRQAIRAVRTHRGTSLDLSSLPPLPYCLTKTNRKNAPFFTAAQWDAIEKLTPYVRTSVEKLMRKMRTIFSNASDYARTELSMADATALENIMQVLEEEKDQTLHELDLRDAVSLVYSKGLGDMDGKVTILPAAYEFEAQLNVYSWAPNTKVVFVAVPSHVGWEANGDYPAGSELRANSGALSNLELIYRFGIIIPENPWGPVFYLRQSTPRGPFASLGVKGWIGAHTPSVDTTNEAEKVLPFKLLAKKTVYGHGTMCYHRNFQTEGRSHGCPPARASGASGAGSKNAQDPRSLQERISAEKSGTAHTEHIYECDYRTTFYDRAFGYGVMILRKDGLVGGFSRFQYQCLRSMLYEDEARENSGQARDGESLATAEEYLANVLRKACSLQLSYSRHAARALHADLRRQKSHVYDYEEEFSEETQMDHGSRTQHHDRLFLDKEGDADIAKRALDVTQMMLEATHEYEVLLQRCVSYFDQVLKDLEMWRRVRLEF